MWRVRRTADHKVHVRRWLKRDLAAVLLIDSQSFPDPWDFGYYTRLLNDSRTFGLVAEKGAVIVGFAVYVLPRFDQIGRIEVERMAVRADWRGGGIGTLLVRRLIGKLHAKRRWLYIPVHEENLGTQKFLRAIGIRADRVIRGSNPGGRDDYLFQYFEVEPREAP